MAAAESDVITMSIDMKKYRIRIHRNTLHALHDPDHIQLLLHPEIPAVLVRRPQADEPFGQTEKVTFDKPGKSGTFELFSKELIHRIQRRYPALKNGEIYRLTGRYRPELRAACFPLPTESAQEKRDEVKENDTDSSDRSGIQINYSSAKQIGTLSPGRKLET